MKAMPEGIDEKVKALKEQADNLQMGHNYLKAVDKYKEALALLPLPVNQWKYVVILYMQISENYWLNAQFNGGKGGAYLEALEVYREIMKLDRAIGKDMFHARIGQIRYELGDMEKAKEEFLRAYSISGLEMFNNMDDRKYFNLIKPIIESNEIENYAIDAASYEF